MTMKVRMLGDMVLLKEVKLEQKSPSGLVLVDDGANQRVKFGDVVSTGPEVSGIQVGDRCVFVYKRGEEIGELIEPNEQSSSFDQRSNHWVLHEDEIDGIV